MRLLLASAATFAAVAVAGTATAQFKSQSDLVRFPDGFDQGVLYGGVDRSDNKQYREFYIDKAALAAVKAGRPLPSGTVITMVTYKAKTDDKGEPVKAGGGRFVKDELLGYFVMEKRSGWGAGYAPDIRNGEWEYQAFGTNKAVNAKANIENCFKCHKPKEADDFLFTRDQLKRTAAK